MHNDKKIDLDVSLVQKLITKQFPEWAHLDVHLVVPGGWDNKTFRLGDHMIVKLPTAQRYSSQVAKEFCWLPQLAPSLPLPIPKPLQMGVPYQDYPWNWGIYEWINGYCASPENVTDTCQFAQDLANFLISLQRIDARQGPVAGEHNFYRGGSLMIYHHQVQEAVNALKNDLDTQSIMALWHQSLASQWQRPHVWVHGDIKIDNLLVKDGKLNAVIDFGCLGTGDPSCDLAIAWTFFHGESREIFRTALSYDRDTWVRGRGWALWKALIIYAALPGINPCNKEKAKKVLDEILADYKQSG